MGQGEQAESTLSTRTAWASIFCFWAFYFLIVTLRSVIIEGWQHQLPVLAQRAVVSLVSAAVTVLLYLAIRRASRATLLRSIVTAGLLAVPAAFIYSAVNYAIFEHHLLARVAALASETALQPLAPTSTPEQEYPAIDEIVGNAVNGYFYFATWATLYLLLEHGLRMRLLERRTAALAAAAQAAELRALRYQVNPHFLFNTFNALSALVMRGRHEDAERMIGNLSDFFRTSLSGDPTADVPLSEEIHLQQLYLEIETVRFPDRLAIDIDLPDTLRSARVPGMILQPLVENAVKHGVARSRARVTLRIEARAQGDQLRLAVQDDGDGTHEAIRAGTSLGLRNVRERLAARYGERAGMRAGPLPEGGYAVELLLPLERDGD
jgi:signal transduction histidine kinase